MDKTLLWLYRTSGKKKIYIFYLFMIDIVVSLSTIFSALSLRKLVDSAIANDLDLLKKYAMILIAIGLIQVIMGMLDRYIREYSHASLENVFKKRLFANLLTKDYAAITNTHSAEWLNRLSSDTQIVANDLTNIIPGLSATIVKLIGALISIMILLPQFAYLIIPGGLVLLLMTYIFRKKLKILHKDIQNKDGILKGFLMERLANLLIVKSFSRERKSVALSEELMEEHKKARLERAVFSDICNTGFSFIMRFAYIASAIYCALLLYRKEISYGTFIAMLQLVSQVQGPFANITGYLPQYYELIASSERLRECESYPDDGQDFLDQDAINEYYSKHFQTLGLSKASFTYRSENETKVIDDLNIRIAKGSYTCICGESGSGKSTILKLLMCLYPLDKGQRFIDQEELSSKYRGLFAYVPQGNQLMSGSIKDIVTFSSYEPSKDEEINEALKIACAYDFVNKLPEKLDTRLGERGTGLSEGQIQRIAIARAIYSDKPLLLLDEATSSLDEKTEAKLLNNLKTMTNKTIIIVTHRNKAKEICDQTITI